MIKAQPQPISLFPQALAHALTDLKTRMQHDYEQAYPALSEIIHLVLDVEEARAWELSAFPHLLLPDLVEAHVAKLNLRPVELADEPVLAQRGFSSMQMPIFAAA